MADAVAVKERLEQGWMKINAVIEIVGAPKEHVEGTLRLLLKKLREEKSVELLGGKVHEPKLQGQGPFFSTFAELEALVKDFSTLMNICFSFMPSSVEIVEPAQFKLSPVNVADLFNELLGRLHEIDMRLKNTNAANQLLEKNLYNLLKNAVLIQLSAGSKSLGELSQAVGIAEQQLEPFLAKFADDGVIRKAGHHYISLIKK